MHSWETKWKSPVFLFQKPEMIQTVEEQNNFLQKIIDAEMDRRDNLIVHYISEDTGIIVDKEELVKLLRNDRCQYEQGYHDGKNDACRWIPISERRPEKSGKYLATVSVNWNATGMVLVTRTATYDSIEDKWFPHRATNEYISAVHAWMPLPEAYREV